MNDPEKSEQEPGHLPESSTDGSKPKMPSGVGVYDRPERTKPSPMLMIGLVILLMIVAFVIFQFVS